MASSPILDRRRGFDVCSRSEVRPNSGFDSRQSKWVIKQRNRGIIILNRVDYSLQNGEWDNG